MNPEEKVKELEKQIEDLKTAHTQELEAKDAEIEGLNKTIGEKDELIEQKNQDIIGARRKYKKLEELSEEERNNMTEAEIEAKKDQDALYEEQENDRKQRQEDRTREVNERLERAIKNVAGDDKEYAEKIRENFNRIKDSEKAYTEGEIGTFVETATNMVGQERPEPVRQAVNQNDNSVAPVIGDDTSKGFADSPEGKSLATTLGIQMGESQEGDGDGKTS